MKSALQYRTCTADEAPTVVDFLMEIGPELYLHERAVAEEMVALLFAHGGVVAGFAQDDDGERLVALIGYFWGDPNNDFADRETGFVYLAAIAKAYRHSGAFRGLMVEGGRVFLAQGVKEVRFHAEESNRYTNMLYAKFAKPLKKEKNRRGITCILYGNSVANVIAYLRKGPSRRTKHAAAQLKGATA